MQNGTSKGVGFQNYPPSRCPLCSSKTTLRSARERTLREVAQLVGQPPQSAELREQGTKTYREAYLLAIGFRNCLWIRDLRGGLFANCANGPGGRGL